MPRVVHFEIPADQPERAIAFYEQAFGWQFQKWDGPMQYWMVVTGEESPGINGGLMAREAPGQQPTNIIDVPSVDDYLARITAAGGEIVMPKTPVPTVGYIAYFKDPEGNLSGLMQFDPGAGQ